MATTIEATDERWTAMGLEALYGAARPVGMTDDELYYVHGTTLFTRYQDTNERDAMMFASKRDLGRYVKRLLTDEASPC